MNLTEKLEKWLKMNKFYQFLAQLSCMPYKQSTYSDSGINGLNGDGGGCSESHSRSANGA